MDAFITHSVFVQTIIIETNLLVNNYFEVLKKNYIIPPKLMPNLHDNMMIIRKDEKNS